MNLKASKMKFCLIFATILGSTLAAPSTTGAPMRQESSTTPERVYPLRVQMKDLDENCEEIFGYQNLVDEWYANRQATERGSGGMPGFDLLEEQFINFTDEQMYHDACLSWAVEVYWDYPAKYIVNDEFKDNMEDWVSTDDYYGDDY